MQLLAANTESVEKAENVERENVLVGRLKLSIGSDSSGEWNGGVCWHCMHPEGPSNQLGGATGSGVTFGCSVHQVIRGGSSLSSATDTGQTGKHQGESLLRGSTTIMAFPS